MFRILLVLLNLNVFFATAQIPHLIWQKCYGTADKDHIYGIVPKDNGFIIALEVRTGEGLTNYHGSYDIWLVNVDSTGDIIWEKCYGGSSADSPYKLIKKTDDEYFIFGYTGSTDGDVNSGNKGYTDLWVVKINGQGDIIWERTYGCRGFEEPRDMILTPDDGFVMIDRIGSGGGDVSNYYGYGDVWICKCDSLGNIEWEKTFGNDGLDNCLSMIINRNNNLMMIGAVQKHGGLVECFPDGAWGDVWIIELDLQGNIVAQHCYGGSIYELGYSLIELDEGYAFTSSTYSNDGDVSGFHGTPGVPGNSDIWVVKLNAQMEIAWQKCLGGYNGDNTEYITQTYDGGFIIIGYSYSNDGDVSGNHALPGSESTDIWVVKLTKDGEIEWQQCYGGWGDEMIETPFTVLKESDYKFVIASSTNFGPSYDVICTPCGGNIADEDLWLFELKDCTHYAPHTPSRPTGPVHACSASGKASQYTVPAIPNQTHQWRLEPAQAGSLSPSGDTLYVYWQQGYQGTAAIIAKGVNGCGASDWSQPFFTEVENCTGIIPHNAASIEVFPNPAYSYFNITCENVTAYEAVFTLYTLSGIPIRRTLLESPLTRIDCKELPSGLYFWCVASKRGQIQGKIIIQSKSGN